MEGRTLVRPRARIPRQQPHQAAPRCSPTSGDVARGSLCRKRHSPPGSERLSL